MTDPTPTPLDLDRLEQRVAAATPGPWFATTDTVIPLIVTTYAPPPIEVGEAVRPSDAEFIAHAREDVPALVAEVRRLRAVIEAAPHRNYCASHVRETGRGGGLCNCWKRDVLAGVTP